MQPWSNVFTYCVRKSIWVGVCRGIGTAIAISQFVSTTRIDRLVAMLSVPSIPTQASIIVDVVVASGPSFHVSARGTATFIKVNAAVLVQSSRYVTHNAVAIKGIDDDGHICTTVTILSAEKIKGAGGGEDSEHD